MRFKANRGRASMIANVILDIALAAAAATMVLVALYCDKGGRRNGGGRVVFSPSAAR